MFRPLSKIVEFVSIAVPSRSKIRQRDMQNAHECDLGLGKFVKHFHVLSRRCLRRHNGPALLERDLQKMDGRKIALGHGLSNHEDARKEIFRTLSSGKTET